MLEMVAPKWARARTEIHRVDDVDIRVAVDAMRMRHRLPGGGRVPEAVSLSSPIGERVDNRVATTCLTRFCLVVDTPTEVGAREIR